MNRSAYAGKEKPRYQRIETKYRSRCAVCLLPIEVGQRLMWDTQQAGVIFCDQCAVEMHVSTPVERSLF